MANPNQPPQGPKHRALKNSKSPSFPDFRLLKTVSEPPTDTTRPGRAGPRKVASYLGLATRASSFSPEPLPPPIPSISHASLVREKDKVRYNPNTEQMVEALHVGFITRGTLEFIPIEDNATVLALIESYAHDQKKIKTLEAERAEESKRHRRSAVEWLNREAQYKAEIKRLEVLLSRASVQGLEAVTLARTNSVVNRNGPGARELAAEVERLTADVKGIQFSLPLFFAFSGHPASELWTRLTNRGHLSRQAAREEAT